jgi:hypothetical protein
MVRTETKAGCGVRNSASRFRVDHYEHAACWELPGEYATVAVPPSPPHASAARIACAVADAPEVVCQRLEFSPAGLSRMENGQTAQCAGGQGNAGRIRDPVQRLGAVSGAGSRGSAEVSGGSCTACRPWVEAAADAVSEFALAHVPGLPQTEDYARATRSEPLVRRTRSSSRAKWPCARSGRTGFPIRMIR